MPVLLFAHGAGAGSHHPFMVQWAQQLATIGPVQTFDYPYMQQGRRAPDRLPKLLLAHREQLDAVTAQHGEPVVLIGKSMGSRVGCHLANEVDVHGIICLGYPLRSPSGRMRDEVLLSLTRPVLFVQGTRDKLCPLDLLEDVRQTMQVRTELHVVVEGDHSLQITKRHTKATGMSQQDSDAAAFEAVRGFVASLG